MIGSTCPWHFLFISDNRTSLNFEPCYSHIHVVDNPTCQCGFQRENNKHFLLECPLFNDEKVEMTNKLAELGFYPTVTNLLYGTTGHSQQVNTEAFNIIQNVISITGQFNGITSTVQYN